MHRDEKIGPDDARDELHPIPLDHFIDQLFGHVGLALIIAVDDLRIQAPQPAANML